MLCIQETWFKPWLDFVVPGYQSVRQDWNEKAWRGCVTLIGVDVLYLRVKLKSTPECVVVRVWRNHGSEDIVNFYSPCFQFCGDLERPFYWRAEKIKRLWAWVTKGLRVKTCANLTLPAKNMQADLLTRRTEVCVFHLVRLPKWICKMGHFNPIVQNTGRRKCNVMHAHCDLPNLKQHLSAHPNFPFRHANPSFKYCCLHPVASVFIYAVILSRSPAKLTQTKRAIYCTI